MALILLSSSAVEARRALIQFADEEFQSSEPIRLNDFNDIFNLHADGALHNQWFQNIPSDQEYKATFDYRVQLDTHLAKFRKSQIDLTTRVEGFAVIDEGFQFFTDRTIDLPELFATDKFNYKGMNVDFTFGKFANRRFLDKDEVSPDNFDIGERFHVGSFLNTGEGINMGSILNTNSLINVMNSEISTQKPGASDTGNYGFVLQVEDPDGSSLFDRWTMTHLVAVRELERFGESVYYFSELKKKWGRKSPGQFAFGYGIGNAHAFQVRNSDDNGYLFYASLVQRYKDFTPYLRWGSLNAGFQGRDLSIHHVSAGSFWQLGRKDSLGGHWVLFDSYFADIKDHFIRNAIVGTWRHDFNERINLLTFLEFNIDQPTRTLTEDSNWTTGFSLQGKI